jgi:hypothetical protein
MNSLLLADTDTPTIIAAIVGPLVGVLMAHIFSKQQLKNVAATELFRRIIEDSYNFRAIYLVARISKQSTKTIGDIPVELKVKLHLFDTLVSSSADSRSYLIELNKMFALLAADKLSLSILFDSKADKCNKAIDKLIQWNGRFNDDTLATDDVGDSMLVDVKAISNEIRELSKLLKSSIDDAA